MAKVRTDLGVGDLVVVAARSRHSDGSHGVVALYQSPGAALRYVVEFSRRPKLTYTRRELIKDNR